MPKNYFNKLESNFITKIKEIRNENDTQQYYIHNKMLQLINLERQKDKYRHIFQRQNPYDGEYKDE